MNEKKNTISEMLFVTSPTLFCDFEQCRNEVRKAREAGNEDLASLWSRAEEAAQHLITAHSFSGKLHDIKTIPLPPSSKIITEGTQLSTTYLIKSTQAFQKNNFFLADEGITISKSIKKAVELYYQWDLTAHEEMFRRYSFNQEEQKEAALKYRYYQAEASQESNKPLSQQWAEAACLAQESLTKAKKTKNTFSQIGKVPLSYYWMIASFWTYRASLLRAAVAEMTTKSDQKKIAQLHAITCCAEQASSYRAKAAKALCGANPILTHYWTLAAFWSGNASHYLQQALFDPLPTWKTNADQALQTASAYATAARSSTKWYHPLAYERYWTKRASQLEKNLESKVAVLITWPFQPRSATREKK
ncbi:MAG: hypothetical protein NT164_05810 [Verrucomicrobiae bacterium]|nr:hypothetical protein [Verrucomicrobiae bacterium]